MLQEGLRLPLLDEGQKSEPEKIQSETRIIPFETGKKNKNEF